MPACPICSREVPQQLLNQHVNRCLDNSGSGGNPGRGRSPGRSPRRQPKRDVTQAEADEAKLRSYFSDQWRSERSAIERIQREKDSKQPVYTGVLGAGAARPGILFVKVHRTHGLDKIPTLTGSSLSVEVTFEGASKRTAVVKTDRLEQDASFNESLLFTVADYYGRSPIGIKLWQHKVLRAATPVADCSPALVLNDAVSLAPSQDPVVRGTVVIKDPLASSDSKSEASERESKDAEPLSPLPTPLQASYHLVPLPSPACGDEAGFLGFRRHTLTLVGECVTAAKVAAAERERKRRDNLSKQRGKSPRQSDVTCDDCDIGGPQCLEEVVNLGLSPRIEVSLLFCPHSETVGSLSSTPSWTVLHRAAADGDVSVLQTVSAAVGSQWLLRRTQDPYEMTVFDVAAVWARTDVLASLIRQYGPTFTTSPATGSSCLHYAVQSGHPLVADALIASVLLIIRKRQVAARLRALVDPDDPGEYEEDFVGEDSSPPEPGYAYDYGNTCVVIHPVVFEHDRKVVSAASVTAQRQPSAPVVEEPFHARLRRYDTLVQADSGTSSLPLPVVEDPVPLRSVTPTLAASYSPPPLSLSPLPHRSRLGSSDDDDDDDNTGGVPALPLPAPVTVEARAPSPLHRHSGTGWFLRFMAQPRPSLLYHRPTQPVRRHPIIMLPWIRPLDVKNRSGQTPLMLAAASGHVAVVGALLRAGASLGVTDASGNTALMLALRGGHVQVASVLLASHGPQREQPHPGETHRPVGYSARPNACNSIGECALTIAAAIGATAIVKTLVDIGCKRNVVSLDGRTPLHHAASAGHVDVVMILLLLDVEASRTSSGQAVLGPGFRHGIGDDGRGGVYSKFAEPVVWAPVDNRGQTPLMLAHAGARAGRAGCAAVLEVFQALQQSEIHVSGVSKPVDDNEPFAEDLEYEYCAEVCE